RSYPLGTQRSRLTTAGNLPLPFWFVIPEGHLRLLLLLPLPFFLSSPQPGSPASLLAGVGRGSAVAFSNHQPLTTNHSHPLTAAPAHSTASHTQSPPKTAPDFPPEPRHPSSSPSAPQSARQSPHASQGSNPAPAQRTTRSAADPRRAVWPPRPPAGSPHSALPRTRTDQTPPASSAPA